MSHLSLPLRSCAILHIYPRALVHHPFDTFSSTLKYRAGLPVLARASIVSRPSVHLHVDSQELRALLTGGRIRHRRGLGMGEIAIVRTRDGRYLEGWEAYAEGVGGEVICKFGGY